MSSKGNPVLKQALEGLRVVVVDDEDDIRKGLGILVASLGAGVREAADGIHALELLTETSADLILTDLRMPRMSGADLLIEVKKRFPETEVMILTGFGTIQTAVSCVRRGAAHFITKPFDNQEVLQIVERLGRQILGLRKGDGPSRAPFIAGDPSMREVMALLDRAAPSPVPVLLEGESGTGKDLLARIIHERSRVAGQSFQAVNTAALPDTLLESELFGYEKGAFTGADRSRRGLFEEADGGTVFLDEVESMSPSFQGKLLRVLQDKVVRPLGQVKDVAVSFRLVSATNRNLEALMGQGGFREDLFFRLGVVRIHIPPLRERPKDIPALTDHFLERAARSCLEPGTPTPKISPSAQKALEGHSWPGNVRELENTIQRAVIVSPGSDILPHHLGLRASGWQPHPDVQGQNLNYNEGKQRAIETFQREFVERALEKSAGNISQAAENCSMTRAALQRIMRQLDIDKSRYSRPE